MSQRSLGSRQSQLIREPRSDFFPATKRVPNQQQLSPTSVSLRSDSSQASLLPSLNHDYSFNTIHTPACQKFNDSSASKKSPGGLRMTLNRMFSNRYSLEKIKVLPKLHIKSTEPDYISITDKMELVEDKVLKYTKSPEQLRDINQIIRPFKQRRPEPSPKALPRQLLIKK